LYVEPLPNPFKTKEDAEGALDAFVRELHNNIDDELTTFATHFTARMHPELAETMRRILLDDLQGHSIDAAEESPEYQLYFAFESEVIRSILMKLVNDYSPNIYGMIQWKIAQRERAMVGAP
jgi:hypothetical protein